MKSREKQNNKSKKYKVRRVACITNFKLLKLKRSKNKFIIIVQLSLYYLANILVSNTQLRSLVVVLQL